ncbi:MAG: hypothetical protein WA659_06165 [Candidatus Aquirickettsiella sp.]
MKNTLSTIKSHEPNSIKAVKIILTLSILAATAVLTTYWLAPIASLFICITVVLFTATALAVLVSYISSKFLYLPKIDPPKKELLDELQTVKQILERGYDRPGDDKEQCKQFIKEVVRYYIQVISKKNNIELDQPHAAVTKIDPHIAPSAPPLSVHNQQGYGTFFHESNSVSNKGPLISTEPIACVNG